MSASIKYKHQVLFERYFQSISSAFAVTLLFFVVTIIAYLAFQFAEGSVQKRCDDVKKSEPHAVTPCDLPMSFVDGQYFVVQFSEATLNRFYDVAKANQFKQRILADVESFKQLHLASRINIIERLKSALYTLFDNKSLDELPIQLPITSGETGKAQVQQLEIETLLAQLNNLAEIYEASVDSIDAIPQFKLAQFAQELQKLADAEQQSSVKIQARANELQPQKSFLWLYHGGSKWLWELVFWSLFGLYSCTLVNLIKRVRQQDYVASEFCFLFPRILLAPVMGVVIVALLSSGYSVQDQNLNNFPYFLMLAFFIGFNSENINAKIRELSNHILNPIGYSAAKQKRLNNAAPFVPNYNKVAESLLKGVPNSKAELERQLRAGAKAIAETETIKHLKSTGSKK